MIGAKARELDGPTNLNGRVHLGMKKQKCAKEVSSAGQKVIATVEFSMQRPREESPAACAKCKKIRHSHRLPITRFRLPSVVTKI